MKKLVCVLLALALMVPAFAFAETDEERIAALEERVAKLEESLAALEKQLGLEAERDARPDEIPADAPQGETRTLAMGESFEVLDGVELTVSEFKLSSYFSYYSQQSSYNDMFGFSSFFGGSRYGQRTIRAGDDNVYLCLAIKAENGTRDDVEVSSFMNAVAVCGDETVEPEDAFLYYSGNYGGYIAGSPSLRMDGRASVDGMLLFVLPKEADDEATPLKVTFAAGADTYEYVLRAGETGLLLDPSGESASF